ncbi:serine hydrolase [Corynebacterium sp.]|uniref:serine hydrolase domain-containing protein n=1 Tax=Corynebacterium sp. TaxID=1720 RepID=UPI0026487C77|nr:serine hydrolase domain-containing protein [Corynebacterium sp.]MDN5721500.1 beta-lactamase family protein [Corynebacterium sp.]MDN6281632.1 beta-lactamase family protein [Corynebacterium sp.]MDN6367339.1 beta-lactamase family protein [Corynebacterium sp.]MDN6374867.1 beta-lactamase family protein [Corynebacterium sp.]MDN6395937.1 beta-lactamase family protein [Corynebacterium sp.]
MKKTGIAVTIAAVLVVILTAGGMYVSQGKPELSTDVSGDPGLIADSRPQLGGVRDSVAVCEVNGADTAQAFFGSSGVRQYEIASLSKIVTGELLAESVRRGEVQLNAKVGDFLDLQDSPVSDVTLSELATHTSGLGYWGDDDRDHGLGVWWTTTVRGNTAVHDMSVPDLLDRARRDPLSTRGQYRYSNIGFALLGQALAQAAGTDYADLLATRATRPLGMSATRLGSPSDRNRMRGYSTGGRHVPAWNLGAYGPSGGIISTPDDMCRFARYLAGPDPGNGVGMSARVPVNTDSSGNGSGLGWNTRQIGGSRVAWKEGQTGGYASAVATVPGYSLVILSNTAVPVDALLWSLLEKRAPLG